MSILFTASLDEAHQTQLKEKFPEQTFIFKEKVNAVEDYLTDAQVIVTYGADITEEMIHQAKQLEWIMVLSAGIDEMPLEVIEERDILVTNVRGIHKRPMAEYAMSTLLYVCRQEEALTRNYLNKQWEQSLTFHELNDKIMLIVGTGSIGQEVARLAQAFNMKTLGLSRSGDAVEHFDEVNTIEVLEEMLPRADFIVSVLPSTDETQDRYTMKEFKQMKSSAVFFNMGRGDAVVEADLLKAIEQRIIAHAILDVFREEPLPTDHPFWTEENITITPHVAAKSNRYVPRAMEIFEANLHTFLKGEEDYQNKIDIKRGY